ncbi:MAG TPA: arylsulfatase [Acidocella sp.]|nr:arylsulfatase [Acidocella sp.]
MTETPKTAPRGTDLPHPREPFAGKIGRTLADSAAHHQRQPGAPEGAPNILLVMLDDAGYANPCSFGGNIETPTFDRIGGNGLRYNRFHNTGLCSPTRAALLSGRNHHSVGFGVVSDISAGYPGYDAWWPKSAASIAEVLRLNGYDTSIFGKWHNTPDVEAGPQGPFGHWPNAMGFNYFYGFIGGETNQYRPYLIENTSLIDTPDHPDYHLTTDLADRAIGWIKRAKSINPDKPFFAYFAPGSVHAPHHAPREWIERYKGKFDQGWDVYREEIFARQKALGAVPEDARLTTRPEAIAAWDTLSDEQKSLYSRMMEVYAGFVAHSDHEIGRVVGAIEELGLADDTLIIWVWSDNGASAEGGLDGTYNEMLTFNGVPTTFEQQSMAIFALGGPEALGGPAMHNHYPVGWAWAGNTPLQWVKQVASHFGGTRTPLAISWPRRIAPDATVRLQFHHVIDIYPTILDLAGLAAPAKVNGVDQSPVDGVSLVYSFADAKAPGQRTQQYFEMLGYRGMYQDGWMASGFTARLPWEIGKNITQPWDPDEDIWELYNIDKDFSQAEDLAARYPRRLQQLKDLWWAEAGRYNVLPLGAPGSRFLDLLASRATPRREVFHGLVSRIPEPNAPDIKSRSHRATLLVETKPGDAGVLYAFGGYMGGLSLYLKDGLLTYHYNFCGLKHSAITASRPLPPGKAEIAVDFTPETPLPGMAAKVRLFIGAEEVASGDVPNTVPFRFSVHETFNIGADPLTPVSPAYAAPFVFSGTIHRAEFDLC